MNGILLVNKDKNITSQNLISKIKRIINANKIGHAGTLDPLATGLLVVLVNNATKLSDFFIEKSKEYVAEIFIGRSTDTLDSGGNILEEVEVEEELDVDSVLNSFLGKSKQTPPMYSAIKQKGVKLYNLARQGIEVTRKEREIEIYKIERLTEIQKIDGFIKFSFRVFCSKGTYIRTLCENIGKELGYPAYMSDLIRTKVGDFSIDSSFSLQDIESGKYQITKMQDALDDILIMEVDDNLAKKILNGAIIDSKSIDVKDEIIGFTFESNLIGIYKKNNGKYRVLRVWN